jgi:uncharacterized protein
MVIIRFFSAMPIRQYRKHFFASLLSSLFLILTPQIAGSQVPTEKTLLWEISGNGLAKSSYLFGTIHSICRDKLLIGKQQRKALDSVQQIYLEIDLDDLGTMMLASGGMRRPGNQSLQELMTPQEYSKVKNFFEKERYTPLWMISNLQPFILTSMVLGNDYSQNCSKSSWEAMLVRVAKSRKLEVFGIEEPDEQFDVFNQVPMKQQIAGLISAIDNREAVKKEAEKSMKELYAAYESQDVDKIQRFINKFSTTSGTQTVGNEKFIEALLNQRNRNWIPRMSKIAQEKPTFFGVGAGHLGGQQGVIALLRKAGYTVQPLYDANFKK